MTLKQQKKLFLAFLAERYILHHWCINIPAAVQRNDGASLMLRDLDGRSITCTSLAADEFNFSRAMS